MTSFLDTYGAPNWEPRYRAFRERWERDLRRDPIYQAYIESTDRAKERGVPMQITSALDVVGEQRSMVAITLIRAEEEGGGSVIMVNGERIDAPRDFGVRYGIASMLANAQPVLWPEEFRIAAANGRLPDGGVELPGTYLADRRAPAWFTFETDLYVDDSEDSCLGMLIGSSAQLPDPPRDPGLVHMAIVNPTGDTSQGALVLAVAVRTFSLPHGVHDGEYFSNEAKLLAFMDSPYIPQETRAVPRPIRRRSPIPSPEVRFITLRKVVNPSEEVPASDAEQREYNCRWLVSGHFRAQPYPSTGEKRLIWIAPHVKGPADKPLKPPTAKAYKVQR